MDARWPKQPFWRVAAAYGLTNIQRIREDDIV